MAKNIPGYTFGVEIECFASDRSTTAAVIAWALRQKGFKAYNEFDSDPGNSSVERSQHSCWIISTDCTVRGARTYEIKSPILRGEEGLAEIRKVLAILQNDLKLEANWSCGLHCHVGITKDKVGPEIGFEPAESINILRLYKKHEKEIASFLKVTRRNNAEWCREIDGALQKLDNGWYYGPETAPPRNYDEYRIRNYGYGTHLWSDGRNHTIPEPITSWPAVASKSTHYEKVSLQPTTRYGTVEFRQHHGTTDPIEVANWALFCVCLVARAKKGLTDESAPRGRGRPAGVFAGMPLGVRAHFLKQVERYKVDVEVAKMAFGMAHHEEMGGEADLGTVENALRIAQHVVSNSDHARFQRTVNLAYLFLAARDQARMSA